MISIHNSLDVSHPDLASEAHRWNPAEFSYGSGKLQEWKCKYGHIFKSRISDRAIKGNGCPYCAGQKAIEGINDLATTHPELAKELVEENPRELMAGSSRKVRWKCNQGHIWEAVVYSRKNGNGCPYCAGRKVLVGFNDLATINPELAKQAEGWDPSTVTTKSSKKRLWKCSLGHTWLSTIHHRSNGTGCPYCSSSKVLIGFNDLETLFPEIAKEATNFDPSNFMSKSDSIKDWTCNLGHRYRAAIKDRTSGKGCPYCAGRKVFVGFNDLASRYPDIANEAYQWNPSSVTPGSKKSMKWKCPVGHVYKAVVSERTRGGGKNTNCPICVSKIVLIGFNDLATTHPEIAQEADGWDPKKYTSGSGKVLRWKCREGHKWNARISSRQVSGCPTCHVGGFDPNQKGYLYLLTHPDWEMQQIGITNNPDRRLSDHKSRGWELVELRGPMDGHLAQSWETSILRMLRTRKVGLGNQSIAGKFDGFSESWDLNKLIVATIRDLMQLTEEFEKSN